MLLVKCRLNIPVVAEVVTSIPTNFSLLFCWLDNNWDPVSTNNVDVDVDVDVDVVVVVVVVVVSEGGTTLSTAPIFTIFGVIKIWDDFDEAAVEAGVNFVNILLEAFTFENPKSAKKNTVKLSVYFALFGSAHVKASSILLMKLTPGLGLEVPICWRLDAPRFLRRDRKISAIGILKIWYNFYVSFIYLFYFILILMLLSWF